MMKEKKKKREEWLPYRKEPGGREKSIGSVWRELFLLPVKLYRRFLSPCLPDSCRFTPTCSCYCMEAVREWGILCGSGLTIWRLLRCQPFGKGGYDPVPQRKKKNSRL